MIPIKPGFKKNFFWPYIGAWPLKKGRFCIGRPTWKIFFLIFPNFLHKNATAAGWTNIVIFFSLKIDLPYYPAYPKGDKGRGRGFRPMDMIEFTVYCRIFTQFKIKTKFSREIKEPRERWQKMNYFFHKRSWH